jgi:hypothetical protein
VAGGDPCSFDLTGGQLTGFESLDAVVAEGEAVAALGQVIRIIAARLLLAVLDA